MLRRCRRSIPSEGTSETGTCSKYQSGVDVDRLEQNTPADKVVRSSERRNGTNSNPEEVPAEALAAPLPVTRSPKYRRQRRNHDGIANHDRVVGVPAALAQQALGLAFGSRRRFLCLAFVFGRLVLLLDALGLRVRLYRLRLKVGRDGGDVGTVDVDEADWRRVVAVHNFWHRRGGAAMQG